MSSPELAKIMSYNPNIFRRSLKKQLIPSFDFFTTVLQSEENAVRACKRDAGILSINLENNEIARSINILRENGVPGSKILTMLRLTMLRRHPKIFYSYPNQFRETVEEVKRMGFNPLRSKFVVAVFALRTMRKLTWEKKVDVYKRWGWSDEDIIISFWRFPGCMMASEKKIMAVMDYYIKVMGLEPSIVCKYPALVSFSLKKRIVPRGSVARVLLSKGLIKDLSLFKLFAHSEKLFLEKFVKHYEEEAPELMKLYTEKLDLSRQLGSE